MINGFISRVSVSNQLKQALDVGSRQTRLTADRVAKATLQNADGFALPAVEGQPVVAGAEEAVDVEAEMVGLADQQLRFEATARLLQKTYQTIRTSIRER